MRASALCIGLLFLGVASNGRAEPPTSPEPPASPEPSASPAPTAVERPDAWETAPATRRSGFTMGVLGGVALGTVQGYPNELSKRDNPAFRSATTGVGQGGTIYLGGALTDYFTFAFGFSESSYGGSQIATSAQAFVFHLEFFPLFARGGSDRDFGLFAEFGTGVAKIRRRSGNVELASSGALSIAGLGAFLEPWRFGHLAAGPFVSWQYESSDSMIRHLAQLGLRGVFYGGP